MADKLKTDIIEHAEEVRCKIRNPKQAFATMNVEGEEQKIDWIHQLLKITLKHSGKVYGLDLSGAQYGFDKPVFPWVDFEQNHIRQRIYGGPLHFGAEKEGLQTERERMEETTLGACLEMNGEASRHLEYRTIRWENDNNLMVRDLFLLPRAQYMVKSSELVDYLDVSIEACVMLARRDCDAFKAELSKGKTS